MSLCSNLLRLKVRFFIEKFFWTWCWLWNFHVYDLNGQKPVWVISLSTFFSADCSQSRNQSQEIGEFFSLNYKIFLTSKVFMFGYPFYYEYKVPIRQFINRKGRVNWRLNNFLNIKLYRRKRNGKCSTTPFRKVVKYLQYFLEYICMILWYSYRREGS